MILDFQQSARSTVGLEWELQLIDKDSNDLRQAANAVFDRVNAIGGHPHIHREMLLNTIELTSAPHLSIVDGARDLMSAVEFLKPILEGLRLDLASGGSHPFANPAYQRVTDSHRYAELVNRTQYWGRQMLLFGTHIHVGIENRDKVLPILSALLTRSAHLQSLTASSPFWANTDTGYADNRAMVFQQLPTAGAPHQFRTWDELERFATDMHKTGVIDSFDEIRWDIRPAPKFGTLEVRICDAASNIHELRAAAAFVHCLVEYFSRMYDAGERLPSMPDWYVGENKWRSARYGMDAILILDEAGNEELVGDTLLRMVDVLEPISHELKCHTELTLIRHLVAMGAPYQRQRRVAALCGGSRDAVVEYMRAEMAAGYPLDPDHFVHSTPMTLDHSHH